MNLWENLQPLIGIFFAGIAGLGLTVGFISYAVLVWKAHYESWLWVAAALTMPPSGLLFGFLHWEEHKIWTMTSVGGFATFTAISLGILLLRIYSSR